MKQFRVEYVIFAFSSKKKIQRSLIMRTQLLNPVLAQDCDEAVCVHDQIGDKVRQWQSVISVRVLIGVPPVKERRILQHSLKFP